MGDSGTNSGRYGELPIVVDRAAGGSLHRQVGAAIRESVRSGRLVPGTRLPPTRVMAADLGVSRGVVVEAYQQLIAEGYLTGGAGAYTTVAGRRADARPDSAAPARQPDPPAPPVRVDFGYGRADVAHFPRAEWL